MIFPYLQNIQNLNTSTIRILVLVVFITKTRKLQEFDAIFFFSCTFHDNTLHRVLYIYIYIYIYIHNYILYLHTIYNTICYILYLYVYIYTIYTNIHLYMLTLFELSSICMALRKTFESVPWNPEKDRARES